MGYVSSGSFYELDTGELYRCPPKDDSYRTVYVPGWLGSLLTEQAGHSPADPCACHGYRYVFGGYGTANGAARRPGSKLVDVARAAGVSTGTVSKSLVNKGFRHRWAGRLSTIVPVCGVAG
jgi:hypothetical protein